MKFIAKANLFLVFVGVLVPKVVEASCSLPSDRTGLIAFNAITGDKVETNQTIPRGIILEFNCCEECSNRKFVGEKLNLCLGDSWARDIPVCQKFCPSLVDEDNPSMTASCLYKHHLRRCGDGILPGTQAMIKCNFGYNRVGRGNNENVLLTCGNDGQWSDYEFKCFPQCGDGEVEVSDVGGHERDYVVKVPWQVAIYDDTDNNNHISSGVIISSKLVLSVANCFWDAENKRVYNKNFTIIAGRNFSNVSEELPGQKRNASQIIIHPKFSATDTCNFESNIAIIVLDSHLHFNPHIVPICIEFATLSHQSIEANVTGQLAVWRSSGNLTRRKEELKIIEVSTISREICSERLSSPDVDLMQSEKFCVVADDRFCDARNRGAGFVVPKVNSGDKKIYFLLGIATDAPQSNCSTVLPMIDVKYFQDFISETIQKFSLTF